jgi:hypothetical protein
LFKDIGKQNLEIGAPPVHCYALKLGAVGSGTRPMTLRIAAVAVGVFAAVGVCGVASWVWLAANSSTALIRAPVTAGSHVPSVGTTADGAAPGAAVSAIGGCEQQCGRHQYPNTAIVANPACQRHGGGQEYPFTVLASCPIRNRGARGQRQTSAGGAANHARQRHGCPRRYPGALGSANDAEQWRGRSQG